MKHDLTCKETFRYLGNVSVDSIEDLRRSLDGYLVAIFPLTSSLQGKNPFIPLVIESGIPVVMTVNAAEGMCEECHNLLTQNPLDPFAPPQNFPFLVSNINEGVSQFILFILYPRFYIYNKNTASSPSSLI